MPNNVIRSDQSVQILGWEDVELCVRRIADWIQEEIGGNVAIYGIPRGGMIPAIMLVHALEARGLKARFAPAIDHLLPSELHKLVVIDEICDSGDTIQVLKQLYPMCKTAVLYERADAKQGLTDFAAVILKNNQWLQFPWEIPACE